MGLNSICRDCGYEETPAVSGQEVMARGEEQNQKSIEVKSRVHGREKIKC